MTKHSQWHISGCPAILLAPLAIPLVVLVKIGEGLGLLKKKEDLTPRDVVSYLDNFLNGGGGEWDWDDFICIPITDPELDLIRQEAAQLDLPLTDAGETNLRELLARAKALAATSDGVTPT